MHLYLNFFGINIPSYGFMITTGVIVANVIAYVVLKYTKQDINDFIILESYCILGAFIGAKIFYFIVSCNDIDWKQIINPVYFNELMQSGFVFYGGLIGGLVFIYAAGKIHNIISEEYVRKFIFLIPVIHSFGRVGCFMAGCCYGIPYNGFGAIIFPENSFALPGVKLFPVQLLEAGLLLAISFTILILQWKKNWYYTIETYLIIYGIVRFILEYVRYDEMRGVYGWFSTSQWISIGIELYAMISVYIKLKRRCVAVDNS